MKKIATLIGTGVLSIVAIFSVGIQTADADPIIGKTQSQDPIIGKTQSLDPVIGKTQ